MIQLIKAFPYDNSYDYIKMFGSKAEQEEFFNTLFTINIDDNNYIKEHKSFNVAYNYDFLVTQGINYIRFNNGFKDIFAFIVKKEYVSEDVTRLIFEIDVIQTYMFDFHLKKSFIERKVCNVDEIVDFDEGLEMGEHRIVSETVVYEKDCVYFAMFTGFKDYIVDEKGFDFKSFPMSSTSRPITNIDGIEYPLLFMPLNENKATFTNYLLDHESLVGIVRLPKCTYSTTTMGIPYLKKEGGKLTSTFLGDLKFAHNIKSVTIQGGSVSVPKATLTDFYPYTYYVLTDGETEPLIMQPQYLQSSVTIKGKTAISHEPVERFYPSYYKGSTDGTVYNITNSNAMMLPIGRNTGLETLSANSSSLKQQEQSALYNALIGYGATAIGMGASALTGNIVGMGMSALTGIQTATSSYNNIQGLMARKQDMLLTPSSIKSFGTPSTRNSFNTNKVKVLKYTIDDKYKERINNFIYRYGNKYNNYATINIRAYKGYIKYNGVNISTNIDNEMTLRLKNIFERGVYIE